MDSLAACVASAFVDGLLQSVQKQLALLQILQLAPATTASQARHAITTMVFISFAERFAHAGRLPEEGDPRPARIDNFGSGKVEREEGTGESRGSRVDEKMRSLATERSKHSYRSSRFALDPSPAFQEPASSAKEASVKAKESAGSFLISLCGEGEADGVEENMRQAENERVNLENSTRQQHQTEQKERNKNAAVGMKLLREKKPFTYDYDGTSQGITPVRLPADAVRKLRQQLRGGEVLKRDRMCETTQVANPKQRVEVGKSLRGEGPVFSEKAFSVVEALGDNSHLSEGIRITELRGSSNNVSLERRTKRPEGKPYRLKDYKDLSKDKSFREFPHTSSRKNSLLDLSASVAENQEEHKPKALAKERERESQSRGRSQQLLKSQKAKVLDEALGRGLPFIRTKGLKFYDIGSASSYKTVDFSFNSSDRRSNWRNSKIKITDASLYEEVLLS